MQWFSDLSCIQQFNLKLWRMDEQDAFQFLDPSETSLAEVT